MSEVVTQSSKIQEPLLKIEAVSRTFTLGDTVVRALDQVSLSIWPGEFVAIMGQSGSGKSTLMNILGCLDRPNSGRYLIHGRPVEHLDRDELATLRRETFGFIFQRYNLLPTNRAVENVELPAVYAGLDPSKRRSRAQELLTKLGLNDRGDHLPTQLSGGQQQRVSIARALMNDPEVILADEPTGALDSKSGKEVLQLLQQLKAEGRTIILITHDEAIAAYAERQVRIRDGKIVEDTGKISHPESAHAEAHHIPPPPVAIGLLLAMQEAFRMALRALREHLLRTAITLLGIIIGVAAVIVMLGVGTGSKEKVLTQINSMGSNLMLVRPGAPGIRGGGDIVTLTPADATALREVPNVEGLIQERNGRFTARFGNVDYATTVSGVSDEFPRVREWAIDDGSFFNARDLSGFSTVAVVGKTVVTNLFQGRTEPVGQSILIGNIPFEIIGVLSERGASPMGTDQDDTILIPYTTGLIRLFGGNYLSSITLSVGDTNAIDETQQAVSDILLARHRTEDFSIRNMASILEMATSTQNTLTILLGSVAAISLLVGGIGVMNIMLVSVTERTKEIGLRMAMGARLRDIMLQFNIEAAVVCALGGLFGLILGFTIGTILQLSGVDVVFEAWPAILAFACAFITGIVFGFLPARKAAMLDPVVALASE